MEIIREPKGIDLIIEPSKRSKADVELVAKAIAHFKKTGEKLLVEVTSPKKVRKPTKEITKP